MKTFKSTLCLFVLLISVLDIFADENSVMSKISVRGKCVKEISPDRSKVGITVENEKSDLNSAYDKTIKVYNKFLKEIKELKLKDQEIITSQFNVKKQFNWVKGKKVFHGFKVSISINVSTSQIKRLSKVISISNEHGIDNIGGYQTFISNDKRNLYYNECLVKAVQNASDKAVKIASALKRKIGKRIFINEVVGMPIHNPPPMPAFALAQKSMESSRAPNLVFGNHVIEVSVQGEFEVL